MERIASDKGHCIVCKDVVINGIIRAQAVDVSDHGMYISTQAAFIEGAVLEVGIDPGCGPIKARVRVEHIHPGVGIGVAFIDLSPAEIAAVRKCITASADVVPHIDEKRVLLVDDSAQSRAIYSSKLALAGYAVIEASSGLEALKLVQEKRPNLVVLDLWMEGIDGFKILQLMQLSQELKAIPVIVLSARSVPADIQKAASLGAKAYLPKMTTTPVKLVEKVKELLAHGLA